MKINLEAWEQEECIHNFNPGFAGRVVLGGLFRVVSVASRAAGFVRGIRGQESAQPFEQFLSPKQPLTGMDGSQHRTSLLCLPPLANLPDDVFYAVLNNTEHKRN
jgi:hypothetical protein